MSEIRLDHLKKELPKIYVETCSLYTEVAFSRKKLGDGRANIVEQRRLLVKISEKYQAGVKTAVNGLDDYDDITLNIAAKKTGSGKRLRSAVVDLQEQFTRQMLVYGGKYVFPQHVGMMELSAETNKPLDAGHKTSQIPQTQTEAEHWVLKKHLETRGPELPGNPNPALVSHLFRGQSENWEDLAQRHTRNIEALCTQSVQRVILDVAPDLAENIATLINDTMEDRYQAALDELARLIQDKHRPVTLYHPRFAAQVRELELDRLEAVSAQAAGPPYYNNPRVMLRGQDSKLLTAYKALDSLVILYTVSSICISLTDQS